MFAAEARSRPHLPLVSWGERNGNADGDHRNLTRFNYSLAFDGSMEVNSCSSTRLIGGDNSEGRKSFDGELGCGHTATVSSRRLWCLARLATKAGEAAAGHEKGSSPSGRRIRSSERINASVRGNAVEAVWFGAASVVRSFVDDVCGRDTGQSQSFKCVAFVNMSHMFSEPLQISTITQHILENGNIVQEFTRFGASLSCEVSHKVISI